jgi:integrase
MGQARLTVRLTNGSRKDLYLGVHGSPESHGEFARVLAILQAHRGRYPVEGGAPADTLSVNELILAFYRHAEVRYGNGSRELEQFRYSLKPLKELYGTEPAARFGPKCLRAVRQRMIDAGLCRGVINRRITRLKTMFGWGVAEELVPPSVAHALREVRGLRLGEMGSRESAPVMPAFEEELLKALPFCPGPVAAMLELQWLTGMRSGEVRVMRTMDLDRTDAAAWTYRPGSDAGPCGKHKNAWRGQERVVPLGPRCIAILTPFLRPEDSAPYLFRPQAATDERNARRRAQGRVVRSAKMLLRKRKRAPKRAPQECYSATSYPRAVARACERAGVRFHPYMLRHGRKMVIEREEGSDAARAVLGQKSIQSTQHYGRLDQVKAGEVMKRLG